MSDPNITKLALANSLKNLMLNKPFDKIRVADIVGNCGVTRTTFYYHFKDKYDLMNWIYYTETVPFMSAYQGWRTGRTACGTCAITCGETKSFISTP